MVSTMTIDMHIQDAQDMKDSEYYAAFQATHKGWIDVDTNILIGDKVVDSEGNNYDVVNLIPKKYGFAINQHLELMLKLNG